MTAIVDLDCYVLPLLDAIVWMGQASSKLMEIEDLEQCVSGVVPQAVADIRGPDSLNTGELLGGVSWVAASLLRSNQRGQREAAEGGAV